VNKFLNDQTSARIVTTTTTTTTTSTTNRMTSLSVASSPTTSASPVLDGYLADLKRVIEWLSTSSDSLTNQPEIGHDVNLVKQQFQTHEVTTLFIYKKTIDENCN
jgi:hypothetical protein